MVRSIKRREPPDTLMPLAVDYAKNRTLRELAEAQEGKLKIKLMTMLDDFGQPIEGGHKIIELPDAVPLGKKMMTGMKRQRRAGQSLAQDRAEKFLRDKGLWDKCTTVVTVINEDAILAANFAGEITDVDLKRLYDEKETFAFYPMYEGD